MDAACRDRGGEGTTDLAAKRRTCITVTPCVCRSASAAARNLSDPPLGVRTSIVPHHCPPPTPPRCSDAKCRAVALLAFKPHHAEGGQQLCHQPTTATTAARVTFTLCRPPRSPLPPRPRGRYAITSPPLCAQKQKFCQQKVGAPPSPLPFDTGDIEMLTEVNKQTINQITKPHVTRLQYRRPYKRNLSSRVVAPDFSWFAHGLKGRVEDRAV
jgi:hypothetical protein